MSTAYTSLCRGLKYLLKVKCIILVYPNLGIFDFRDVLFGQVENIGLFKKKYHKKEWNLCFVAHSFTKLSQNVCLVNVHIWVYHMPNVTAGYGRFSDLIEFFFGEFSYITCLKR